LVLLITVIFTAIGYTRGIIRGVTTIVILYVATGVGAIFYRSAAPYTGVIKAFLSVPFTGSLSLDVNMDNGTLAFSFCLLTLIAWIALGAIMQFSFPDTGLPGLGILDNLGGVIIYFIIGALTASLLFNALGYGRLRPMHDNALLRPAFNQVVSLHYTAQSFWFPKRPPAIYVYDLDLPRGP